MRILVATAALSLLVAGCAVPDGSDRPTMQDELQDDLVDDDDDPADDEDPRDDEDPANDEDPTDDPGDDDPVDGWDALPPEAGDGSLLTVVITCGLLQGPHTKTFEKDGDIWTEIESIGAGPYEELYPCMGRGGDARGDKFLTWDDEPSLYMNAAGLDHDLWPTETEDRWFGEVAPTEEPSRECVDNLASMGMTFPIAMTLEVIDVELF